MPSLPPYYRSIVIDQQAQLARLVRSAGVAPIKRLYQEMMADLEKKLASLSSATFSHQQIQGLLAQVRLGLARLQSQMRDVVKDGAVTVGIESARTLLTNAAKLEKHFTGAVIPLRVAEIGRLRGLANDQVPSLMRVHDRTMARYGTRLVGRFETTLASSLALGETQTQAIDRVIELGDVEWWQAERIVRTETAFAGSAVARAASDEQADELDGDMWTRWTEHVSDDGVPFDDRVGVDSEALHGQVAPPGGMFVQPPTNRKGDAVQASLVGQEWAHPPNRPNDRSVLVPWRAHWGVPGWIWDGRRVPITETRVAKVNEAWMRKRAA